MFSRTLSWIFCRKFCLDDPRWVLSLSRTLKQIVILKPKWLLWELCRETTNYFNLWSSNATIGEVTSTSKNHSVLGDHAWSILPWRLKVVWLRREWVLIYSLYISSKDADNSQCDLTYYPYEDLLHFLRVMSGAVYIYKYLFPLFNVFYKHYVSNASKITPSREHISALRQDILNSYSSIVIQIIKCHHCYNDGRLQTEQICKGVFSTVFISLRQKWCFVR